ncbi:MAG: PD-(D/E)XK nuclease-like domain-containing protein [Elusimicrobia bacterium]|nr:PD-(D/E)XK nuclease-like domain-containing protein [Elusimicrobiota bacterium]
MNEFGRTPAPKPGFYKGVDFDTYASWDAVNSHILTGLRRTPAHLRHELLNGGLDPTPSLEAGWLLHLAVLEPERFEAEVVVPPKVDRRTTQGKATWAGFQAANPGKRSVDADLYSQVCAMRDSLRAHPSAGAWFERPGANEVSIVWEEREAGVVCKARIDRVASIGGWPIVGDVKTARNAARRPFERVLYDYGYHIQARHYLAGLEALSPIPDGQAFRRFCFFVVETEAPYCVAVYELDETALAAAEQDRQKHLRTWRQCVEAGEWPGYPVGIELVSIPAWALKVWEASE